MFSVRIKMDQALTQISMRWPENQGDDMWEVHPVPMEVDTKPWQIWKSTAVAKGDFWTKPWMKMNDYQWFNLMTTYDYLIVSD